MRSYTLTMDEYQAFPEAEQQRWNEWVKSFGVDYRDVFKVEVIPHVGGYSIVFHRYYRNSEGAVEVDQTNELWKPKTLPPLDVVAENLPPFVAEKLAV